MAMDPEIRQAIDELKVLVAEALKASGAIDKATGSAGRQGERTSVDAGRARAATQSGLPSGTIPGYIAASAMASTFEGRLKAIQAQFVHNMGGGARMVEQGRMLDALRPDGGGFAHSSGERVYGSPGRGLMVSGSRYMTREMLASRNTIGDIGGTARAVSGAPGSEPMMFAGSWMGQIGRQMVSGIPQVGESNYPWGRGITNQNVNRSFWRRTRNEYVSIAQSYRRRFGRDSWSNLGQNVQVGIGAAAFAAFQWNEAQIDIQKQFLSESRDAEEQIRQRNVQIGQDMQTLANMRRRDESWNAGVNAVKTVADTVVGAHVMRTTAMSGLKAGLRGGVTAVAVALVARGVLRGIDYFSGAEQERFDTRNADLRLTFREQTGHVLSKETQDRMQNEWATTVMVRRGFVSSVWAMMWAGASTEEFEKEGLQLAKEEFARQAPKIQEARESVSYGDTYVAGKKFDEAMRAMRLGDDAPMMWKNPQKYFSEMESSRIASRNWARSQMSRAKSRTGD